MRRLFRTATTVSLLALLVGGCASRVAQPSTALPPSAPDAYLLQPGDVLTIKFYNSPDLNEDVIVRPDGDVSLQLLGDVRAAGRRPQAFATYLSTAYARELTSPKVAVIVRQLGSNRVHVGGEVAKPGVFPLNNGLTVWQAIHEAGSFLETAHRKQVVLIRRQPDGTPTGYIIDTRPIASGDFPGQDVLLQPFDIVYVPRSKIANVNLFVKQYIRDVLPIQPGFAFVP